MKVLFSLIALLFVSGPMKLDANPLAEYKWKNRIIVASMPGGDGQKEAAAALRKHKLAIADRDLIVFDVTPARMRTAGMKRLPEQKTKVLRDRLSIGDEPAFVLIGKDGGVKSRQTGTLDLEELFALIDTMPMRKEEMRKKKG